MASSLIAQVSLSLTQISSALGYTEQSALSRSCVRWFGRAPRRLRQMKDTERSFTGRLAEPTQPERQ